MLTMLNSRWIDENKGKVWDIQPTCRGPEELGGSLLKDLGFNSLYSMVNLSPRIPIRQVTIQTSPTTKDPEQ